MTIVFCGHREFQADEHLQNFLTEELLVRAAQTKTLFCYTGGYGGFDWFCAHCINRAQKSAPNLRNCLVIPYLTLSLQKRLQEKTDFFDEIIYPPLELVPPRCAILRRNYWMVDRADLLVAYITHDWGGAAKTYRYAKQKNVPILLLKQ